MSRVSFKTFCIEMYAEHIGKASNEVYKLFSDSGLLKILDEDYEGLHGMSWEFLNDYFDKFLTNER